LGKCWAINVNELVRKAALPKALAQRKPIAAMKKEEEEGKRGSKLERK
jgi:hypothetical protein